MVIKGESVMVFGSFNNDCCITLHLHLHTVQYRFTVPSAWVFLWV